MADRDIVTVHPKIMDAVRTFSLRPSDRAPHVEIIDEGSRPFTDLVARSLGLPALRVIGTDGDMYASGVEPSSWSWRRDWPCHAPGASALLFLGLFPTNVAMAYDWRDRPAPAPALTYGRLPLQVPLHLWARAAGRSATG